MADYKILTAETIDVDKFTFGTPKANNYGGKAIPIKYDEGRFYLKLRGRTPFGVARTMTGDGFNIQINVSDPTLKAKIEAFDELILNSGFEAKAAWGIPPPKRAGKPFDMEHVQDQYKPMLKYPMKKVDGDVRVVNPDYDPYIQVTFPQSLTKTDPPTFTCEFYDSNAKKIEDLSVTPKDGAEGTNKSNGRSVMPAIPNGSEVAVLITATSAWGSAQGFGVSWKVSQIRVFPPATLPKNQCLLDEGDEEEVEPGLPSGFNALADENQPTANGETATTNNGETANNGEQEKPRPRLMLGARH